MASPLLQVSASASHHQEAILCGIAPLTRACAQAEKPEESVVGGGPKRIMVGRLPRSCGEMDWWFATCQAGEAGVPEDKMSVGAPGQGAPGGVWAGGQLVLHLGEPGREKRVSRRNESRRRLAKSRPEVHCFYSWRRVSFLSLHPHLQKLPWFSC